MKFFFDNCLSPHLAKGLHAIVQQTVTIDADGREEVDSITHLSEKFRRNTPDVEWIARLGEEGSWIIIISGDQRIQKRPQERLVLKAAKLTTFFMAHGFENYEYWDQVKWMIDKWQLIREQAGLVAPGAAFIVPKLSTKKFESVTV